MGRIIRNDDAAQARPFVKMAGGKTKLLPEIRARMPKEFGAYYEPFVGGGALFFDIFASSFGERRYVLGDMNRDLVTAYREIRDNPDELIRRLRGMENNETFYYCVRAIDLDALHPETSGIDSARAARMIYLNKTCFNGLHRVNRVGRFNVPFGRYAKPLICDRVNILACSKAFARTSILHKSFHRTALEADAGDFVYFDPPYVPLTETSNFTTYAAFGFKWADHVHLFEIAKTLKQRGVHVLISNSNNRFIRQMYEAEPMFKVEVIHAARSINAKADGRGKIEELLIS